MENHKLFEKELERLNLDLEKTEGEEEYVYILKQPYEEINTNWLIFIDKKGFNNFIVATLLSIPESKKNYFLNFLNSLNEKYYNSTFFLNYDEENKNYRVRLQRCYACAPTDFNAKFFINLIFQTHSLLGEVIPQLIKAKYN